MPEPKNDGIMSLNVKKLLQTCVKYFEKKRNEAKLDEIETLWYLFMCIF